MIVCSKTIVTCKCLSHEKQTYRHVNVWSFPQTIIHVNVCLLQGSAHTCQLLLVQFQYSCVSLQKTPCVKVCFCAANCTTHKNFAIWHLLKMKLLNQSKREQMPNHNSSKPWKLRVLVIRTSAARFGRSTTATALFGCWWSKRVASPTLKCIFALDITPHDGMLM